MGLASDANVYSTCLRILRSRGFSLRVCGEVEPDGSYPEDLTWVAEKEGFHFAADNPIELLGLTAIFDFLKPAKDVPYWWNVDGPDIWQELLDQAFPNPDSGIA